jgi:hypothetical protein
MKIKTILSIFLFLFSIHAYAEDSCISGAWSNIVKTDSKLGYISTYLTNRVDIKIEDLLCILGSEFFRNISEFPEEATVSIINKDIPFGYVAKWSLTKNSLVLIKLNETSGIANIYPKPMERFEELFTNKTFPTPRSPNAILRRSVHSKKVFIDSKALNLLVTED